MQSDYSLFVVFLSESKYFENLFAAITASINNIQVSTNCQDSLDTLSFNNPTISAPMREYIPRYFIGFSFDTIPPQTN